MYWQWSQVQQLKEQLAQDKKMLEQKDKLVAENDLPPAKPGFKWVPHGDHFHQVPVVPVSSRYGYRRWRGEPHDTPITQPVQAAQEYKEYTGPLTFHKELLETNPLEALRLQCEERGHWSAKWIAEFPADDQEAQAFARTVYLCMYYDTLYRTTGEIPISDAEYKRLGDEYSSQLSDLANRTDYRSLALMRISWPFLSQDAEPIRNN